MTISLKDIDPAFAWRVRAQAAARQMTLKEFIIRAIEAAMDSKPSRLGREQEKKRA